MDFTTELHQIFKEKIEILNYSNSLGDTIFHIYFMKPVLFWLEK